MMPIRWTQSARADLLAIFNYIGRDSQLYAQRMVERIQKAVDRLRDFPRFGSSVPEWDREEIREILVGNYRIIYRLRSDSVEIVAVLHGARQLPPMLPNP